MATEIDDLQINISASSNNAKKSLDDLASILERLTSSLRQTINQSSKIGSSRGVKGNFDILNKSIKKTTKNAFSLAAAFGKFYASYFLVIRGIKNLWKSIVGTTDLIEAFNYYTVSLGKIASEWSAEWEKYGYENSDAYAKSFTDRLNTSLGKLSGIQIAVEDDGKGILSVSGTKNLGLNIKEITQYASQLASVMNSVGQTGETTIVVADSFTRLAGDISSLFNVDYSSVSKNLQSGLIGQSRALYKYGIDITNATLQTYAYELGIEKAVSEMTQSEKMQLRMIAILKQSKVAWGDLANTISSPNNMLRQFKNNLNETGIVLGQLFIPLLENVLPVLNGFSIAIKNLLIDIAGLLGIELDFSEFGKGYDDTSDGLDGIADSLDYLTSSAKKAKGSLRGFDELNVVTTSDSSTSGLSDTIDLTNEIISATEEYNRVWEQAYAKMENRVQEFAERISGHLEPIKTIISDIKIGNYFKLGEDVSRLVNGILIFFTKAIEKVDWYAIGKGIGDFLEGLDWYSILKNVGKFIWEAINASVELWKGSFEAEPIATIIITSLFALPALATAVSSITTIFSTIGAAFSTVIGIFSGLGTVIGTVAGALTGITGLVALFAVGLGLVYATNEDVRNGLSESVKAITDNFQPAIEFVTETILPSFKQGWENIVNLLSPFVEFLKTAFTDVWMEVINPALMYVGETVIPTVLSTFENLWKNVLEPFGNFLINLFSPAVSIISDALTILWKNVVLPLSDAVGNLLSKVFENLSAIFNNRIVPAVSGVIKTFDFLWKNILSPIVNFIWDVLKPAFEQSFSSLGEQISGMSRSFGGIIDFIGGAFSRDWSKAWQGIVDAFGGIWDTIVSVAKAPINLVIGLINGMIDAVENGLNYIVDGINKLSFDVPNWVPGIGGEHFGFDIGKFKFSEIPYLIGGGFVPNTADLFMANENGIPELVGTVGGKAAVASGSEITGIRDAIYSSHAEEMELMRQQNQLLMGILQKEFGISGKDIYSTVKNYENENYRRTGNSVFVH